jgi:hypothetical protein
MSNVLALLGFVLVLVAVALLAGWRWSILGAGAVVLLAAYAAHTQEAAAPDRRESRQTGAGES